MMVPTTHLKETKAVFISPVPLAVQQMLYAIFDILTLTLVYAFITTFPTTDS